MAIVRDDFARYFDMWKQCRDEWDYGKDDKASDGDP